MVGKTAASLPYLVSHHTIVPDHQDLLLTAENIADELAKPGYVNERGAKFSPSSVQSMLSLSQATIPARLPMLGGCWGGKMTDYFKREMRSNRSRVMTCVPETNGS